jgi:Dolichyl-phosphate-mannose-protein mannosyltransferase
VTLVDHAGKAPRGDHPLDRAAADAPGPTADAPRRIGGVSSLDLIAAGVLLVVFGLIVLRLHTLLNEPLSNDEQWRAYWASLSPGQFLAQLAGIPAPVGLGWLAIERASIEIFGNAEWALRLPPFLSIYVLALATYLLARRLLPWSVSLLVGVALLFNGPNLVYGLQTKEDVFVSTCAVVAVLLWIGANDPRTTTAGRWVRYVLIGLLGVSAIPAVFAIAPLLALDLWRAFRGRQLRRQLPLIATSGAIILANFALYVEKQTAVLHIDYWQGFFAPHQLHGGIDFVGEQLRSYVPGVVTAGYLPPDLAFPFDTAVTKAPLALFLSVVISIGMLIALVAGCIRAWRSSEGRTVLTVVGGALVLELAGSVAGKWPFGLVRVNLLVIPFLYLLMGTGIWALVGSLRRAPTSTTGARHAARRATSARPALVDLPKWVICALLLVACVAGGIASWRVQSSLAAQSGVVQYVGDLRGAVHMLRVDGKPGDVAVVIGDTDGWKYYMDYYEDASIPGRARFTAHQTLYTFDFQPPQMARFITARRPRTAYVVDRAGASVAEITWQQQALSAIGYCQSRYRSFSNTATVIVFERATVGCPAAG